MRLRAASEAASPYILLQFRTIASGLPPPARVQWPLEATMTHIARRCIAILIALLAAVPAFAQAAPRSYSQAELDQMLAPIALYPDPVLQQVFIAATRPLEAAEALAELPQILQRMRENPDWARALGEAIVFQEPAVMDTVQQLRRRADAAGNLQSDAQVQVERQASAIVLQPASPAIVYVPYYDPLVVYGPWWWPAYRPVAWAPWPGYARPYYSTSGFWWGAPAVLSVNFLFGSFDWNRRRWHAAPYSHAAPYRQSHVARPLPVAAPQVSPARQMQLRSQQVQTPQQVSPARQMQLRSQQAPAPAAVARPNMRYHPPSFGHQGAQGWTRSQSSPAPAAGSARPQRSRF
jgi:hypothetical protein